MSNQKSAKKTVSSYSKQNKEIQARLDKSELKVKAQREHLIKLESSVIRGKLAKSELENKVEMLNVDLALANKRTQEWVGALACVILVLVGGLAWAI